MRQAVGQVAVVGEDHQPLALGVQAANGEQMPLDRQQLAYGLAIVVWILRIGGQHVDRLVEHVITLLDIGRVDLLPVHLDGVGFSVGFVAQRDDLPVDAHPPLLDDRFAGPAGTQSGLRHQFLYSLFHHGNFLFQLAWTAHYSTVAGVFRGRKRRGRQFLACFLHFGRHPISQRHADQQARLGMQNRQRHKQQREHRQQQKAKCHQQHL